MNRLAGHGTRGAVLYRQLPFASPGQILPGERGRESHDVSRHAVPGGPPQANEVTQGDWRRYALQA
jgi:hypothetical protein